MHEIIVKTRSRLTIIYTYSGNTYGPMFLYLYQSKRKPGKSNADRTVGSEEEKVQKRLKTIDRPDASAEEEGEAQVGVTIILMNFVFSVDIFCSFMFYYSGRS